MSTCIFCERNEAVKWRACAECIAEAKKAAGAGRVEYSDEDFIADVNLSLEYEPPEIRGGRNSKVVVGPDGTLYPSATRAAEILGLPREKVSDMARNRKHGFSYHEQETKVHSKTAE